MRCADTRAPESVLNSVIGNRYYAPVKGGKRGLEAKKKKKEKRRVVGRSVARFRPSLSSPPPWFVIEGVSSRSENRGALLASADLKMYPFLPSSFFLSRSLYFFSRENCKRDIEFKLCPRLLLPPLLSFLSSVLRIIIIEK